MSLLNSLIPSLARTPAATNTDAPVTTAEPVPTVKPAYEIKETNEAFGVVVYLPGVTKEGLELTAEDSQVRILGRRGWKQPEGWTPVYRESTDAAFELVLNHDNAIDVDKIAAELRDGVLRVSLPKQEAIKPRKIAVN
jgi:HSP20 family molecular chaperone IbpA